MSRICRLAAAIATLAALAAATAPAAQAGWSRPFDLMAPGTLDVTAPAAAVSGQGIVTAAWGLQDVDAPGSAQAQVGLRAPSGTVVGAQPVPGAAQALALTESGSNPILLTGSASAGATCCSAVAALPIGPSGAPGRPQPLLSGLDGQTLGRLVALGGGRTLAAVATGAGVWATVAGRSGRFGRLRRLAGPACSPETLASAWLGGGGSLLAWASVAGSPTIADPRTITVAQGSRGGVPGGPRTAVTVRPGHRIDDVAAAARGHGTTLAWIESWSDAGGFHEQVAARDLAARARTRALSGAGASAAGLQLAGDPSGDQAIAWQACRPSGACSVMLASHRAGRPFGPARAVGAIDPGQLPSLSLGDRGQLLLAWSRGGSPVAIAGAAGRAPGTPHRLSPTTYAYDVTTAVGATGRGAVVWSQGTLNPTVVGVAHAG